jgi:hypothetical protein
MMDRRGKWLWLAGALVACGLLLYLLRPPESAEKGVPAAVRQFADGVNTWRLTDAMKVVSTRFRAGGLTRGDISRGLWQARRSWQSLKIYISHVTVQPEPGGRAATARVDVAVIGLRAAGVPDSVGEDKPVAVICRFEREGRHWRCVQADNLPWLTSEGIY